MANVKASAESAAGALDGTEIVRLSRGSGSPPTYSNVRTTTQTIADLAPDRGLFSGLMSASVPTVANTGFSTWVNQGTSTRGDGSAGLWIKMPSGSGGQFAALTTPAPSTPYTRKGLLCIATEGGTGSNNPNVRIGWTDGTKFQLGGIVAGAGTSGLFYTVTRYSDASTFVSNDYAAAKPQHMSRCWFQIADDGTTISVVYSQDGDFSHGGISLYSVAKASGYLSNYNTLAFCAGNGTDTVTTIGTLESWG